MSEQRPGDEWEERLRETAREFSYPPTPDIAGQVRRRLADEREGAMPVPRRRPVWAPVVAALALVLAGCLAVPEVRAAIGRILRIGAIEIVVPTPTPAVTATLPPATAALQPQEAARTPAPTPRPTPTLLASLLDLTGETNLEEARRGVPFPIRLPTYPAELGPPDRVFLQNWDGPVAVLVWLVPGMEDQVRFSLHLLASNAAVTKLSKESTVIEETTVNGNRAVWLRGPHMLYIYEREGDERFRTERFVQGNVLIWEQDQITYRLEGNLSLDEARRIAESVR